VSELEIVSFRPEPGQFSWTFGGVGPVMKVRPGTVMRLWSEDAFAGRVRGEDDLVSRVIEFPFVNPQTGPFFVDGAEPGDTLAVHFISIMPDRDWGASSTIPLFGSLTPTARTAMLSEPLPERIWMYEIDVSREAVIFNARSGEHSVELPLDPMLGTVGVAPAAFEARSSLVPDMFGGNMDTPEMRAGVTCYLGVNVEGALFSLGDGHARQGEGETCGVAIEVAMDTIVLVDLIKAYATPWPRLESDDYLMSIGSSRPLEDAFRIAHAELVRWLQQDFGFEPLDAYQLVTQAAETPIANVVDPNYSVVAKIRKSYLPSVAAAAGMHASCRERARTVTA
jgi:acetamidase/formamidase